MVNAMRVLSGAQLNADTPVLTVVTCRASPPDRDITYIWELPSRLEIKASQRPFDDHAGRDSRLWNWSA